MPYVQIFLYLQVLDLLTTLVGFRVGAAEASPFVRLLMHVGPTAGVVASKLVALGLGCLCIALHRQHLLRKISYWYGGIVVWNLCVILTAVRPL